MISYKVTYCRRWKLPVFNFSQRNLSGRSIKRQFCIFTHTQNTQQMPMHTPITYLPPPHLCACPLLNSHQWKCIEFWVTSSPPSKRYINSYIYTCTCFWQPVKNRFSRFFVYPPRSILALVTRPVVVAHRVYIGTRHLYLYLRVSSVAAKRNRPPTTKARVFARLHRGTI